MGPVSQGALGPIPALTLCTNTSVSILGTGISWPHLSEYILPIPALTLYTSTSVSTLGIGILWQLLSE